MKTLLLPAIAIAMIAIPTAILAAEPDVASCSGIKWNTQFLADYPKAAATCREVTVKDGVKYAKFVGQVSSSNASLVEVDVHNVAGTPIDTVAFQVGVGDKITLDDREARVKDLKAGDNVTFWVQEGQFGISPTLTEEPMKIVKPTPMPVK